MSRFEQPLSWYTKRVHFGIGWADSTDELKLSTGKALAEMSHWQVSCALTPRGLYLFDHWIWNFGGLEKFHSSKWLDLTRAPKKSLINPLVPTAVSIWCIFFSLFWPKWDHRFGPKSVRPTEREIIFFERNRKRGPCLPKKCTRTFWGISLDKKLLKMVQNSDFWKRKKVGSASRVRVWEQMAPSVQICIFFWKLKVLINVCFRKI